MGTFPEGRASGLVVGEYRGVPEVSHGGATAGYRAYLARYPEQGAAVALLCNTAGANAGRLAHAVADAVLADAIPGGGALGEPVELTGGPAPGAEAIALPAPVLEARAGIYRNMRSQEALRIEVRDGRLAIVNGPALDAVSEDRFVAAGRTLLFDAPADPGTPGTPGAHGTPTGLRLITPAGDTLRHEAVEPFDPSPTELEVFTGAYHSDEAEATYRVELDDGQLVVRRRFGRAIPLQPIYTDAFDSPAGTFWFERDRQGRVVEMHLGSGRVWDMAFRRER